VAAEEFEGCDTKCVTLPLKEVADGKLDEACECFTCREHSKAYVSYLAESKEVNARVEISIVECVVVIECAQHIRIGAVA
jgi:tRNA-guanine family transglycosylase